MDIKDQLVLKEGDILLAEGFTLMEAMSANELFDKKIDTKMGLKDADHPDLLLKEGQIKTQFTNQEVIGLFDLTMQKWMLWLNGHALAQTVYMLIPQYSDQFWSHPLLKGLYQALNTSGSQIFKIVRDAPFLKEEDYNPSIFSFRTDRLSYNELIQSLTQIDSELQQKVKKGKQGTVEEALSSRAKILKGFVQLINILSQPFSVENQNQIDELISFIRKRLENVKLSQQMGADMSNYLSDSIYKHIQAVISMRKVPKTIETYHFFEQMLNQLEQLIELSKQRIFFNIYQQANEVVHNYPKNILIRSYLESSIFKFDQFLYFNQISWTKIVLKSIGQLYPNQNFDQLDDPDHKDYIDYLVSISYEYVTKQLRGKFRQQRDISKFYRHISILIHLSQKLDQEQYKNKSPLTVFSYEIALQVMIQQTQLGFELELYNETDYSFIFFYYEYFISILIKNRNNFIHQLTPAQTQDLVRCSKKVQVTPIVDQIYFEQNYYKGLQQLLNGYSRLAYSLLQYEYIRPPPSFEFRYSNRLKIFENCFFIKWMKFEEFIQTVVSERNLTEQLDYVRTQLFEAQQSFQQLKEIKYLSQQTQDQAKEFTKICVTTSVHIMKFKANPKLNVRFVKSKISYIPQFETF